MLLSGSVDGAVFVSGGAAGSDSYAWTVTKNGAAFASGNESAFAFTPDDNGTYQVSLKVNF